MALKFRGMNLSSKDPRRLARFYRDVLGAVCLVFDCDDHEKTYQDLKEKGVSLDPPQTAAWGGKELFLKDPDGNTILIL